MSLYKNILSKANLFWIPLAFVVCIIYWIYIYSQAQYVIAHDIPGYLSLADTLKTKGWIAYFQTGPNREPLYPLLLSLNMRLAELSSKFFIGPQIISQVVILLITQILTLIVLKRLKVNHFISAMIILYQGISPGLIHATFILYSEIIVFPFIPLIILANSALIENILKFNTSSFKKVFFLSAAVSLLLLILVFTKAVFEIVAPLFVLLTFAFILFQAILHKNSHAIKNACILFVTFILLFYPPILFYKSLNKKFNQHFALTDRGAWALYGQTARRMLPYSNQRFLASISYATGWRNCLIFFSKEQCIDWTYVPSDEFGGKKKAELSVTNAESEIDPILIDLSFRQATKNPFQYILFWGVENIKVFFWDTTQMQYVVLPATILNVYRTKIVDLICNNGIALLTILAICYLACFLTLRFRKLNLNNVEVQQVSVLISIFALILPYSAILSFFFILPRYALPLASIYLIAIAFMIQNLLQKKST